MIKGQFYNFTATNGMKLVNINNIAAIEDLMYSSIKVTLNVKNKDGNFISFIADHLWAQVAADIKFMDENQNQK